MFHMADHSGPFRTRAGPEPVGFELVGSRFEEGGVVRLPLYEAKMVRRLDHRFATYDDAGAKTREPGRARKADPAREPLGRCRPARAAACPACRRAPPGSPAAPTW